MGIWYFTSNWLYINALHENSKFSKEVLQFDAFTDISETKEYINKLLERMSEKNRSRSASYWFIRRKSDDRLLGSAGLVNLNYQRQSIEYLCISIRPSIDSFSK